MSQPKVIYNDMAHTYHIDGKRAISGTQAVGKYHRPFESDYWSYNEALKRLLPNIKELRKEILEEEGLYKYPHFIKPPAEVVFPLLTYFAGGENAVREVQLIVLEEYRMSGVNGTTFHIERENESIARGYEINPWTGKEYPVINPTRQYDNQSIKDNLYALEDGYYPELVIWDELLQLHDENGNPMKDKEGNVYLPGIAGQADKVFIETIDGIRYIDIDDYKTNKKRPSKSKFLHNMYAPLDHLFDTSYVHYNLQSTLYAGMLKRAGYVVRNLAITHYMNYDVKTAKRYDFEYLEFEFNVMFGLY